MAKISYRDHEEIKRVKRGDRRFVMTHGATKPAYRILEKGPYDSTYTVSSTWGKFDQAEARWARVTS